MILDTHDYNKAVYRGSLKRWAQGCLYIFGNNDGDRPTAALRARETDMEVLGEMAKSVVKPPSRPSQLRASAETRQGAGGTARHSIQRGETVLVSLLHLRREDGRTTKQTRKMPMRLRNPQTKCPSRGPSNGSKNKSPLFPPHPSRGFVQTSHQGRRQEE